MYRFLNPFAFVLAMISLSHSEIRTIVGKKEEMQIDCATRRCREEERRGTYCANDRLIVTFRSATRSMSRLVGFLAYRRVFRILLRLALHAVMAVATQKDISPSVRLFAVTFNTSEYYNHYNYNRYPCLGCTSLSDFLSTVTVHRRSFNVHTEGDSKLICLLLILTGKVWNPNTK